MKKTEKWKSPCPPPSIPLMFQEWWFWVWRIEKRSEGIILPLSTHYVPKHAPASLTIRSQGSSQPGSSWYGLNANTCQCFYSRTNKIRSKGVEILCLAALIKVVWISEFHLIPHSRLFVLTAGSGSIPGDGTCISLHIPEAVAWTYCSLLTSSIKTVSGWGVRTCPRRPAP